MIVGFIETIALVLVVIPIILKIDSANSVVMSLFGYIPFDEIDELINQSEAYLEIFLDERQ